MIQLAQHNLCTGCGACSFICPKNCIKMVENDIGVIYPVINSTDCIECKSCQKVCPVITPIKYNYPKKAFAAWSNDEEERRTSASGGIAAELYKMALKKGYKIIGAAQQPDFSVKLKISDNIDSIGVFKNSKYVKSTCFDIYGQIRKELKEGNKVLCICLPCQVGALRSVFKANESLVLADIVCHGGTPYKYLKQHISYIEKQAGLKCFKMSFRDPNFETYKYYFSLYGQDGKCFYSKRTVDGDTYQFGFHRSVTYRENCFNCIFAKSERASDITLLDFKGLNDMSRVNFNHINVSGVLANTTKGLEAIESLKDNGAITIIERPVDEPLQTDPRLREHSKDNADSFLFRKLIKETPEDFEGVMQKVIESNKKRNRFSILKRIFRRVKNVILHKK